jgi:PAS domain S-box-containing protein
MRPLVKAGLAVGVPIAAGLLQLALWDVIQPLVWFLFYPAVFFCALFAGFAGGVAATAISTLFVWYAFVPPRFSFEVIRPTDHVSAAGFLVTGIIFSYVLRRFMERRAEKVKSGAQAESDQRFRLMTDCIKDYAIMMLDPMGRIVTWNQGAARLKGYDEAEIIGQSMARFYSPEDAEAGKPARLLAKALEKGRVEDEGWRVRKDGSRFYADVVITPMYDGEGELQGFVKVTRDITERRAMEERLRAINIELEQFAYVASHDLRQPLRMITSYLQLIERRLDGQLSDELREFMNFATGGARRMDRLISDLLDYSRTGRASVMEPVALGTAATAALTNLSVMIADAKAAVALAGDLPTIAGDTTELIRLFQNLVGNAVKYGPPDRPPEIRIGWQRLGRLIRVWVKDNGIGIAPKDQERAFLIFQRLVADRQYEGTGIGLAVCKKIMEHHGGRIWLESELGRGSTFYLDFPHPAPGSGA